MPKCICLYSGGLDSRLVIALMSRQPGIEVIAYHGLHCFEGKNTFDEIRARVTAECLALGAKKVVFRDMTAQITGLLFHNQYGYGKNINPCLDCRINTVSNGFAVMVEEGADFVCTGEVIGQRPKSQQRDGMNAVEKRADRSGYTGRLLRPLCAKLLEPTLAETEGWISRDEMKDFSGRSRHPQFTLARELGVVDYPAPAGGCLLTDENFCRRLQDLMDERQAAGVIANADLDLLKFGRHYRAPGGEKIVVSRNGDEGDRVEALALPGDELYVTAGQPGALVLLRAHLRAPAIPEGQSMAAEGAAPVRGQLTEEGRRLARGLAAYNSKFRAAGVADVECTKPGTDVPRTVQPGCVSINPEESGLHAL